MSLKRLILNTRSPKGLANFYVDCLGMNAQDEAGGIELSYPGTGASLVLQQARSGGAYQHRRDDRYWKIGITVPNVDIAHDQLHAAGIDVSEPHQFGDIGYMCHFSDPEGFSIELLQHHFEANRPAHIGDPGKPLGGGTLIGQITLRTANIAAELAFYRDRLGMCLLSVQPVTAHGFTLYFLAFTDEVPPGDGPEDVENRQWLWQRPYTTLEFQAFEQAGMVLQTNEDGKAGLAGIEVAKADIVGTTKDPAGTVISAV